VKANPRDEPYIADLIPVASAGALTGSAEHVAARVRDLAAAGVTEVAYQPAGSDIQRELCAFASATGISG
jgi:5,10-methylenetetrahydromethanopterin reductase